MARSVVSVGRIRPLGRGGALSLARRRPPNSLLSLLLLWALACALSCKSRATELRAELIAAPESLLAEATLQDPDSFWRRLRSGAGGSLLLLPDTAAGLILAKARLDPRLANLVMGGLPFHVALGEAASGGLAFAIAMKVRDLHTAESALGAWDAGARRSVAGMALLAPLAGLNAPETATALSPSGYLVIASSETDLATLGPYAASTLPSKPAPKSPLEIRAAAGALAQAGIKATNLGAWVTSGLLGLTRRALPPMFDSAAFVACVNPILVAHAGMLADLEEAKVDIETGDGEIHGVATLTPKDGDNGARRRLASIHPADAAPLLDAPADASYAIWASDTPEERTDDAATIAPCLERALGAFLGPEGVRTLDGVFTAWARGRADWDRVALISSGNANGLVIGAPVADAASASHALQDLTDIIARPPVSDALEQIFNVRPGVVERAVVPPLGNATLVTFSRQSGPPDKSAPGASRRASPPPPSAPIGMAWAERASEIDVGLGQAPRELLALAGDSTKLGSDRATAIAVHALGTDASFAAVLRPFGCCRTGGSASTPLTFAWGRHGDAGWSRIEMGYGLLAQLATQPDSVRSGR